MIVSFGPEGGINRPCTVLEVRKRDKEGQNPIFWDLFVETEDGRTVKAIFHHTGLNKLLGRGWEKKWVKERKLHVRRS